MSHILGALATPVTGMTVYDGGFRACEAASDICGCSCSGEAMIGGVVMVLAVKVIQIRNPQAAASVHQEVEALKAVRGRQHILQYVHHTYTADRSAALLSTRCVIAAVNLSSNAMVYHSAYCYLSGFTAGTARWIGRFHCCSCPNMVSLLVQCRHAGFCG